MKIVELNNGSGQRRRLLAMAFFSIVAIIGFVVFLSASSGEDQTGSVSPVPLEVVRGIDSGPAPVVGDESSVGSKGSRDDLDRQIAVYIENMKRAEAESTEFLGERYLGEVHVMEFLIDCDELRTRMANIKVPEFESEEQENEIKGMFDKGEGRYVFLEVNATMGSEFWNYEFASFILGSRDELVHIEGTNRHFARTPLDEWFSAKGDTDWRYDFLVKSVRSE